MVPTRLIRRERSALARGGRHAPKHDESLVPPPPRSLLLTRRRLRALGPSRLGASLFRRRVRRCGLHEWFVRGAAPAALPGLEAPARRAAGGFTGHHPERGQ